MTKRVSRTVLSVLSLYGLATCQGCSFLFVQPAPAAVPHDAAIHCTADRIAPSIDTIFTVTNLASTVYVAMEGRSPNTGSAVALGIALTGLWMSSAIYGFRKTSECEELMAKDDDDTPYRPANYVVVSPDHTYGRAPAPLPPAATPPGSPVPPPAPAAPPGPQNLDAKGR